MRGRNRRASASASARPALPLGGVGHQLSQLGIVARLARPSAPAPRWRARAGPRADTGRRRFIGRALDGVALQQQLADGAAALDRAQRPAQQGRQPFLPAQVGLGQPVDHVGGHPDAGASTPARRSGWARRAGRRRSATAARRSPARGTARPGGRTRRGSWAPASAAPAARWPPRPPRRAGRTRVATRLGRAGQQRPLGIGQLGPAALPQVLGRVQVQRLAERGHDAVEVVVGRRGAAALAEAARIDRAAPAPAGRSPASAAGPAARWRGGAAPGTAGAR